MSLSPDHKLSLLSRTTRSDEAPSSAKGFTLVELVSVLAIIGVMTTFATWRMGNFDFWRQETFIRKFSETIIFLHHQAIFDQMYYALEVDITNANRPQYKVGVFNPDPPSTTAPGATASVAGGTLSTALAFFLSPSVGTSQAFTPSPTFPSLANAVEFPQGVSIEDIRTMSGKHRAVDGGKVYIMFSPRGFSEFAVFHFRLNQDAPVTILVNPFTGTTEILREYKDFKWSYGKKGKDT